MDNLEKKIKSMEGDLQYQAPRREEMWSQISDNIDNNQGQHHHDGGSKWWTSFVGLTLLGLVLIGLVLGGRQLTQPQQQILIPSVPNEANEINFHYAKLVDAQVKRLNKSADLTQEEKDEFLEFINELSAEQKELSDELNTNIENEELLKATIENFKQQIKLIEQLLERVESRKLKTYESDGIFM